MCLYPSLSKRRTSPFLSLCYFIFTVPTCLGNYTFQGSVFSQALWGRLCFPAGSELPSTTDRAGDWNANIILCLCQPPKWAELHQEPPRAGTAIRSELSPHPGITSILQTILVLLVIPQPCSPPWNPSFSWALAPDVLPSDTTLLLSSPKNFLKHKSSTFETPHLWCSSCFAFPNSLALTLQLYFTSCKHRASSSKAQQQSGWWGGAWMQIKLN